MRTNNHSRYACLVAVAVWLAASASEAQVVQPERVGLSSARLERIGELVDRHIEAGEITGAVTLVARNGRIAHLEAQGVMDLASGKPMATDTIFRIASMSKPVAGVAIMMLVEEGRVRLDDPVSRYLPSFADPRVIVSATGPVSGAPDEELETFAAAREVTVFDLLTHTSGVMSGSASNAAGRYLSNRRHEVGLAWVDELGRVPLEFEPGARWAYSALAGFDVLSRIVELASGQDFDSFLESRIFEPLGMHETSFWPTPTQRQRVVTSYELGDDGTLAVRANPDSMSGEIYFSGAGGLMTTAEDYAQFAMMLANRGSLNGVRLLAPRTVDFLGGAHIPDTLPGRPAGEGYGLSVRVITDPIARGTLLSEGAFGWSGAYGTHFWADPKENLVGILMIQTPIRSMRPAFELAVMQALIE